MPGTEVMTEERLSDTLSKWDEVLKTPLWYEQIVPILLNWWENFSRNDQTEALKTQIYSHFADKLDKAELFLAASGPDLDQWRKPIDAAVIHYTDNKPGITWQVLSAIGLLRQYAHDYYKYDDVYSILTKDQPIWSGHFRDKRQVFYAYHWLVRNNGDVVRLLDDSCIGWHAGNKDINFRSVAIVLDGQFTESEPSVSAVGSIANILKKYYPQIKPSGVVGHFEANSQTLCPGKLFLPVWKEKILARL